MRFIGYIFSLLLLTIYLGCANPVTPQGGPKDVTAPKLILTDPEYLAVDFNGDKISLTFDEWVVLSNINKNFISSPPLSAPPKIKLKKRTVNVVFTDSLRSNTTYSFYFGDMITDLNEGNLYQGLTFTLSTGNYVDSLSIIGSVVNAFDMTPMKGHLVLGYIENEIPDTIPWDSIAMRMRPDFVTVTDAQGKYKLQFLPDKKLRLVAINDINGNYMYNKELNEDIAFISKSIMPISSIEHDVDSLKTSYTIHSFKQVDSINKVLKVDDSQPMRLNLTLRYPSDYIEYKFIKAKIPVDSITYNAVISKGNDSLMFWFPKYSDSLQIEITTGIERKMIDTVSAFINSFEKLRKEKKSVSKPSIQVKYASNYHYYKPILLEFSTPVSWIDNEKSKFIIENDTLTTKWQIDTDNPCFVRVDTVLVPDTKYQIVIPDSTFMDIYGNYFPQYTFNVNSRSIESYGNLELNVANNTGENLIIQLLDDKNKIIKEQVVDTKSSKLEFYLLNRGDYKIKAILDINKNGRWDTGDYFQMREPEQVLFFDKTINVRENWDIEEDWIITH